MFNSLFKKVQKILNPEKEKYYKQLYSERDIQESHSNKYIYNSIKESLRDKNPRISIVPITPVGQINFHKISLVKLKKEFGKPKAKYRIGLEKRKVEVYLYKNIYAGFKTTITAHFYQKEIFNLRYEFKVKDKNDATDISNLLGLKYLNGDEIDFKDDYLVDENNVVLSFRDDFSLILDYHNDSEIFNYISYLVEEDDAEKQNQVYNKYKKLYKKL